MKVVELEALLWTAGLVYLVTINPYQVQKFTLCPFHSEAEGATFWLSVMTELKKRGVKVICIACVDGLKVFPDAINAVFQNSEVQLCIVHQIRNSMK